MQSSSYPCGHSAEADFNLPAECPLCSQYGYTDVPTIIEFTIPSVPVAQPRQRHRIMNAGGRQFAHNYTPTTHPVNAFKAAVQLAARQAFVGAPMRCPLSLTAVFVLPRPQKFCGKKYLPNRLRHAAKPDSDNLRKSLTDALEGIVFANDSQICEEIIKKYYAAKDEQPCAIVAIGEAS